MSEFAIGEQMAREIRVHANFYIARAMRLGDMEAVSLALLIIEMVDNALRYFALARLSGAELDREIALRLANDARKRLLKDLSAREWAKDMSPSESASIRH